MDMKAFAAMEPGKTAFVDLPVPEPEEDEALIKVEGCVICNTTDRMVIHSHYGAPGFPVLVGHESVGRVVKTGKNVRHLKIGDRVTRANAIPKGFDGRFYSAWGGFAEYGIVKDKPPVPGFGELPLNKAGLLIALSETASCLMQIEPVKGRDVLVTGTGIAGLSLVYFSRMQGANRVYCTGRREERLALARKLGADETFLAGLEELSRAERAGLRVDFVFEASGQYDIFQNGVPMLKKGGTLAIYGAAETPYLLDKTGDYNTLIFAPKEEMAYETVCALLRRDESLAPLLMTHLWKFGELERAFEQAARGEVIKGMALMD